MLVGLRVTGKRQAGQMTPFDLVLLLLIANAVQNAMTGPDTSVLGGVLAAATLLVANTLIGQARRRIPRFGRLVEGAPTVLIKDGQLQQRNLDREDMTEDELMAGLRDHGVDNMADVALAELEVDGTISVVQHNRELHSKQHRSVRFIKRQK